MTSDAGSADLEAPRYGYADASGRPYRPSWNEVLREWFDSVDFFRTRRRFIPFLGVLFHGATFIFLVLFSASASLPRVLLLLGLVSVQVTLYNTLWLHRYCTHHAFSFKSLGYARFFLWTNPFFIREETYVLAHLIHHQRSDEAGDPFGPHLGWLGSYLAIESVQKLNTDITEDQFEILKRRLAHIGFKPSSFQTFKKWGTVENPACLIGRTVFAQTLYTSLAWAIGGFPAVVIWLASVFLASFFIRNFNWRGHGGFGAALSKKNAAEPKNQLLYGYLASEWHKNHHERPGSANNGFLPYQLDIAFLLIKAFRGMGIVSGYNP